MRTDTVCLIRRAALRDVTAAQPMPRGLPLHCMHIHCVHIRLNPTGQARIK